MDPLPEVNASGLPKSQHDTLGKLRATSTAKRPVERGRGVEEEQELQEEQELLAFIQGDVTEARLPRPHVSLPALINGATKGHVKPHCTPGSSTTPSIPLFH